MSEAIVALVALAAAGAGAALLAALRCREHHGVTTAACEQILLPFTGPGVSPRVLDAALRLAAAERATLMPAYLARVPRHLPLDAALPRQSAIAMPALEAIEQAAAREHVAVDARVARGRTFRHALENLLHDEPVDRVLVPATGHPRVGLSGPDLVWLLERAPAEVLILRPRQHEARQLSRAGIDSHIAAR